MRHQQSTMPAPTSGRRPATSTPTWWEAAGVAGSRSCTVRGNAPSTSAPTCSSSRTRVGSSVSSGPSSDADQVIASRSSPPVASTSTGCGRNRHRPQVGRRGAGPAHDRSALRADAAGLAPQVAPRPPAGPPAGPAGPPGAHLAQSGARSPRTWWAERAGRPRARTLRAGGTDERTGFRRAGVLGAVVLGGAAAAGDEECRVGAPVQVDDGVLATPHPPAQEPAAARPARQRGEGACGRWMAVRVLAGPRPTRRVFDPDLEGSRSAGRSCGLLGLPAAPGLSRLLYALPGS